MSNDKNSAATTDMDNREKYSEFHQSEDSSIVTLSPIVELEESSIFDSDTSIIPENELDDNLHIMSFNDDFLSLPERENYEAKIPTPKVENIRKISLPQTPPEELRKRVSNLVDQINYISSEYEELKEFSKLEKQATHMDCIPKEKVVSLQHEFSSINIKVEHLMEANTDLKNKLIETEKLNEEMVAKELKLEEELKEKNLEIEYVQTNLAKIIEEDAEEINKLNMFICSNTSPSIQEGILQQHLNDLNRKCIFENFLFNRNILKQKKDMLYSIYTTFDKDKEHMSKQLQQVHSNILSYKKQNIKLKHEFDITVEWLNKAIATIISESKNLYEGWCEEKNVLETVIANLKSEVTVNDIQDEIVFLSNEFEKIIETWDLNKSFTDLFCKFKEDDIFCLDILVNSNTKTTILHVLDKLITKLNCYDELNRRQFSSVQDLHNRVQHFESDSDKLKEEFKILGNEVNLVLSKKIKSLENIFTNQYEIENSLPCEGTNIMNTTHSVPLKHFNECKNISYSKDLIQLKDLQVEITCFLNELLSSIDTWNRIENLDIKISRSFIENTMPKINKLIDENTLLDLITKLKIIISRLITNYSHHDFNINLKSDMANLKYDNADIENKNAEELKLVKEQMVHEICSLNNKQNYEDLITYPVSDILAKLIQDIMLKEDDLSSNLQKQYKNELDKYQEMNENMSNKLKTQESWVKMLEIDNEKMNIELATLRKEKIESDTVSKTISSKLKYCDNENIILKNKILECNTENDELVNKIDVLKDSLKTQKEFFQGKINELNKELTSNIKNIQENVNYHIENDFYTVEEKPDYSDSKSSTKLANLNECDNIVINNELQTTNLATMNIINELQSEKNRLKNLFKYSLQNINISEQLSNFSDNVPILKDVVVMISNAIMDIESKWQSSLNSLQSDNDTKNKELNILKESMYTMFNEYSEKDFNCKSHLNDNSSGSSIIKELQCIQDGSMEVVNKSKEIKNICSKAHWLFKNFEEHIKILKTECNTKLLHIDSLKKIIETEKNENKQLKVEQNIRVISLKEQISCLESQLSFIDCAFSKLGIGYPLQATKIDTKIKHIIEYINQSYSNNKILVEISNNCEYFSRQCNFMASYIADIEQRHRESEEQNHNLLLEINILKNKVNIYDAQIKESNSVINKITANMPVNITSVNQANEFLNNLHIENKSLKESEISLINENKEIQLEMYQLNESLKKLTENNKCLQEDIAKYKDCIHHKITSDKVIHLQNEVKTLIEVNTHLKMELKQHYNTATNEKLNNQRTNKLEEDLKLMSKRNNALELELSKCQDYIRSLRSEVRSIRLLNNKKECSTIENQIKPTYFEIGIQTDDCRLKELEYEIAEHKETIIAQGHKITALELKIQNESYPYKIKVSDLEKSLYQAKEKIKSLSIDVMLHKKDVNNISQRK